MEVARLLEYAVHEELVAWYMRELNRCPLEHYRQGGVDQVLVADRKVFQRLGELTRGGVSLAKVGSSLWTPTCREYLLSPLQQTGGAPCAAPSGGRTRERQGQMPAAESRQLTVSKAEIQHLKAATNNRRDDSGGGKGRGGKDRYEIVLGEVARALTRLGPSHAAAMPRLDSMRKLHMPLANPNPVTDPFDLQIRRFRLVMLLGSGRYMETSHVVGIVPQEEEVLAPTTKVERLQGSAATPLNLVLPRHGLFGLDWVRRPQEFRLASGMDSMARSNVEECYRKPSAYLLVSVFRQGGFLPGCAANGTVNSAIQLDAKGQGDADADDQKSLLLKRSASSHTSELYAEDRTKLNHQAFRGESTALARAYDPFRHLGAVRQWRKQNCWYSGGMWLDGVGKVMAADQFPWHADGESQGGHGEAQAALLESSASDSGSEEAHRDMQKEVELCQNEWKQPEVALSVLEEEVAVVDTPPAAQACQGFSVRGTTGKLYVLHQFNEERFARGRPRLCDHLEVKEGVAGYDWCGQCTR